MHLSPVRVIVPGRGPGSIESTVQRWQDARDRITGGCDRAPRARMGTGRPMPVAGPPRPRRTCRTVTPPGGISWVGPARSGPRVFCLLPGPGSDPRSHTRRALDPRRCGASPACTRAFRAAGSVLRSMADPAKPRRKKGDDRNRPPHSAFDNVVLAISSGSRAPCSSSGGCSAADPRAVPASAPGRLACRGGAARRS